MRFYPPGTRKGNKFYVARFWVAGSQHEISTKTTNLRDAKAFAKAARAELIAEGKRLAAKDEKGIPLTFGGAAERYSAARLWRNSDLKGLARISAEIGRVPLEDVTLDTIARVASKLYPHHSPATLNREVYTRAAAVLHYAAENEWCAYRKIRKLREPMPAPRRVSADDMRTLIAASSGVVRKLLTFLYLQGWRIGEALRLKREHVNFKAGTLMVHVRKAGRWKTVPMHPDVATALREGEWYGDKAFPWGSVQAVYYHFDKLEETTGIRFTAHMARYAFAGENRELGATSIDLVDLGTWTSPRSTERYQASAPEHAHRLIRRRAAGETPRGNPKVA